MKTVPVDKKKRTRRLNDLESACLPLEHTSADQREFVVSPKQWQAFLEALDRPAHVNPRLAQLFSDPVVLPHASNR
jgi:uncharacterized protein (DUF1778 family)